MKVAFRVDSSRVMGAGHAARCLALAEAFREAGIDSEFVCRKHSGNLIPKIRAKGFDVIELEVKADGWLGASTQVDAGDFAGSLSLETFDWVIVDHYGIGAEWHKAVKQYAAKLMVIDDLADREMNCELLLNQNFGRYNLDYAGLVPSNCRILAGSHYALLRPEFAARRTEALKKRNATKKIKNVLVSIGGSDAGDLTGEVLRNISNKYNVVAVLGPSSPHIEAVLKYEASYPHINVEIDAANMASLMYDADISVGAGGSTSWERCCLGLPTLLYVTAENQRGIACDLEKIGAVRIVDNLERDLDSLASSIYNWKLMSSESAKICDGHGAMRVAEYLLKF
jgi:UDP-2,4-diacetamido-2,4,6-trideoxy-beta-L-altropyranose hydrolase